MAVFRPRAGGTGRVGMKNPSKPRITRSKTKAKPKKKRVAATRAKPRTGGPKPAKSSANKKPVRKADRLRAKARGKKATGSPGPMKNPAMNPRDRVKRDAARGLKRDTSVRRAPARASLKKATRKRR